MGREKKQRCWKQKQKSEPNTERKRSLLHQPREFDETRNNASTVSLVLPHPLHLSPFPPRQPLTLSTVTEPERLFERERQ